MVLSKMTLPADVSVGGKLYAVRTGHPWWFRFAELMKDKNAVLGDFDFLYDGETPEDRKEGFDRLIEFFAPKRELPRAERTGAGAGEIAIDYTLDADFIYAGILEQYGVDLLEKELHWHKVLAMINGLHGTKLNEIIGYRLYRTPGKDASYDKDMQRLRKIWRIETPEDILAAQREREFFSKIKKPGGEKPEGRG